MRGEALVSTLDVARDYERGLLIREITAKWGVGESTVWTRLHKAGITPARLTPGHAQIEDAQFLLEHGSRLPEVMARLGTNKDTFWKLCHRHDRLDLYWALKGEARPVRKKGAA